MKFFRIKACALMAEQMQPVNPELRARFRSILDRCLSRVGECEAADLYGGDLLEEEPAEAWWDREREALRHEFVRLMLDISTEHLRRGETDEAIGCLERGITQDPGREELYRKQMSIYSRLGDISGVENALSRCREYLRESYGVEPSQQTAALYARLVAQPQSNR